MVPEDLSKENFSIQIYSYDDSGVTDQLYSFGLAWIGEIQQRATQIETKATTLMGWSIGILAFLFTNSKTYNTPILKTCFVASSLSLLSTVIGTFTALRTRSDWQSYSDRSWVPATIAKSNPDDLKRYHLRAMHEVKTAALKNTNKKAKMLQFGEVSLTVGAFFFAIAIVVGLSSYFLR